MKKILLTLAIYIVATAQISCAIECSPTGKVCYDRYSPSSGCSTWLPANSTVRGYCQKVGVIYAWVLYTGNGRRVDGHYDQVWLESDYIKVESGFYGAVSYDGDIILPPQFSRLERIRDNFAVQYKNYWGLTNSKGEFLTDIIYTYIYNAGGAPLLRITYGNINHGIMGDNGNVIIQPQYNKLDNLYDNTLDGNIYFWAENQKLINIENKKLFDANFEKLNMVGPTIFEFKQNNKWGLIDVNGKILAQPIYDKIDISKNNWQGTDKNPFFKVKLNGKWGAVDSLGNLVIPCNKGPIQITNAIKSLSINQEQIAKQNSDIGTAHMNAALVLALSGYRDKANEYINVARAYLNNSGEKIQQFTSKVNKINTENQSMLTNKQLYDRANSAYKSGNYTQAVDYLSKIINSNTLDKQLLHDAYNLRYIIKNYNLNDEKGAASDYAKLLELEK